MDSEREMKIPTVEYLLRCAEEWAPDFARAEELRKELKQLKEVD